MAGETRMEKGRAEIEAGARARLCCGSQDYGGWRHPAGVERLHVCIGSDCPVWVWLPPDVVGELRTKGYCDVPDPVTENQVA